MCKYLRIRPAFGISAAGRTALCALAGTRKLLGFLGTGWLETGSWFCQGGGTGLGIGIVSGLTEGS